MNREDLEKLSPEALDQLNSALHEALCKTIIELLQDNLEDPGLTREEVEAAREFAEIIPKSDEAMRLLEFLEKDEVRGFTS